MISNDCSIQLLPKSKDVKHEKTTKRYLKLLFDAFTPKKCQALNYDVFNNNRREKKLGNRR